MRTPHLLVWSGELCGIKRNSQEVSWWNFILCAVMDNWKRCIHLSLPSSCVKFYEKLIWGVMCYRKHFIPSPWKNFWYRMKNNSITILCKSLLGTISQEVHPFLRLGITLRLMSGSEEVLLTSHLSSILFHFLFLLPDWEQCLQLHRKTCKSKPWTPQPSSFSGTLHPSSSSTVLTKDTR